MDARTIAMLARAPSTSLDEAVVLIERYARTFAAHAAMKATEQAFDKALSIVDQARNAPLVTSQQRADELLAEHQAGRRTYGENCANPAETVRSEMG